MKSVDLATTGHIIETLAFIPDEQLNEIVKAARAHRAKQQSDKIPQAFKDSLLRKVDRLDKGQTVSILVKPELRFTFTVRRQKDWTDLDYKVELLNEDDSRSKEFFQIYDVAGCIFDDPLASLSKIEPHLYTMEEQENSVYDSWNDDYSQLSSEFGVNAWDLVEEIRNDKQVLSSAPEVEEGT